MTLVSEAHYPSLQSETQNCAGQGESILNDMFGAWLLELQSHD